MSEPNTHYSDEAFLGTTSFGGPVNLPAATVYDQQIGPGADIAASKLRHRHPIRYGQKDAADVASETAVRHLSRAAGDIVDFRIRPTTVPAGGNKQYTVDIQKAADASGSWTSLLTAPLTVNSSSVANTAVTAVLAILTYSASDAFRIVITASGTTGSQGQGLDCCLTLDEKAA